MDLPAAYILLSHEQFTWHYFPHLETQKHFILSGANSCYSCFILLETFRRYHWKMTDKRLSFKRFFAVFLLLPMAERFSSLLKSWGNLCRLRCLDKKRQKQTTTHILDPPSSINRGAIRLSCTRWSSFRGADVSSFDTCPFATMKLIKCTRFQ